MCLNLHRSVTCCQLALALALSLVSAGYVQAQSSAVIIYSNGKLDRLGLPRGAKALAINDRGDVAGSLIPRVSDGVMIYECFATRDGRVTTFAIPDWECTAYGINSKGSVVGWAIPHHGFGSFGFQYADGKISTITIPNCSSPTADGINNKGDVVGSCTQADSHKTVGFVRDTAGVVTFFTAPRYSEPYPLGIADDGRVVGYFYNPAGDKDSFLYSNGSYEILWNSSCVTIEASAISSNGLITGSCLSPESNDLVGFVLDTHSTLFRTFAVPKGNGTRGINVKGQMVVNSTGE